MYAQVEKSEKKNKSRSNSSSSRENRSAMNTQRRTVDTLGGSSESQFSNQQNSNSNNNTFTNNHSLSTHNPVSHSHRNMNLERGSTGNAVIQNRAADTDRNHSTVPSTRSNADTESQPLVTLDVQENQALVSFDNDLFEFANVNIQARKRFLEVGGTFQIQNGIIPGVRNATVTGKVGGGKFSATVDAEVNISGIEYGVLSGSISNNGLVLTGNFNLSPNIPGIKSGNVSVKVTKEKGNRNFITTAVGAAKFDFPGIDSNLSVSYENSKLMIKGALSIPEGTIPGIQGATITAKGSAGNFSAEATAKVNIKGLANGVLSGKLGNNGLALSGNCDLAQGIPGIKSGSVAVNITKEKEEFIFSATGSAQLDFPGVNADLSVAYENGLLMIRGTADISDGVIPGIQGMTITADASADNFSATAKANVAISGIASGVLSGAIDNNGFALGGTFDLDPQTLGIKSGNVTVNVTKTKEQEGFNVSASGNAVKEINGKESNVSIGYNNGSLTVGGEIAGVEFEVGDGKAAVSFDNHFFELAEASVDVRKGFLEAKTQLTIGKGKIPGVKKATIKSSIGENGFSAKVTAKVDIPGVKQGDLLGIINDKGFVLGGNFKLGRNVPGIKEGDVSVRITKEKGAEGFDLAVSGTAVPSTGAKDERVSVAYENGSWNVGGKLQGVEFAVSETNASVSFDNDFFEMAGVDLDYSQEFLLIGGTLKIKEGKIPGIKDFTITGTAGPNSFLAEANAVVDIPGIQQGTLSGEINASGFALQGNLQLTQSIPGIKNGMANVVISKEAGQDITVAVKGAVNLDILGVDSSFEVTYEDGQLTIGGTAEIPEGKIPGIQNAVIVASGNATDFSAEIRAKLGIPGLEQGDVFGAVSNSGFSLGGDFSLASNIPGIKSGKVAVRISKEAEQEGVSVSASGSAELDIPGVDSTLTVSYINGVLTIGGTAQIPDGTILGIQNATITANASASNFSAEAHAELNIPGVESGAISGGINQSGFYLQGDFGLSKNIKGIKSGEISVRVSKTNGQAGFNISAVGTASPDIPGIDTSLLVAYDNGDMTLEGSAQYDKGILSGRIKLGATKGREEKEFTFYGDGMLAMRLAPWLEASVGARILPNAEIEVDGKIGLPQSMDLFKRYEFNRTIFRPPSIQIPLFAIPLGVTNVGLVAQISGELSCFAGVGPGQLRELFAEGTFNPSHPENASIHGFGQFVVPANAGLSLSAALTAGVSAGIASVTGGIELAGTLGVNAEALAQAEVNWSPRTGLTLDALASITVSPQFIFDINAILKGSLGWFEKSWRHNLKSFAWGSDMEFGIALPVHYEQGKPFNLSFDDLQITYPEINVIDTVKDLAGKVEEQIF